jgi:recombinational DNA repair protein RecT
MAVRDELAARRQKHDEMVQRIATNVVAAMPLSVPDEALKRARARFRVVFSADTGKLAECTPESVARAVVLSALSGLFPGGPNPDVWLIPRKNKHLGGALEANWQMAYRGYIRLARRAGWDIEPVLVFDDDDFAIEEGMEPKVSHKPNLDGVQTWETLRGAYARVFPVGNRASTKIAWLSKRRIVERRAKAPDQGIWNEWPLEQTFKTICNFAGQRELFPCDDPARYAIAADMASETGDETIIRLPSGAPQQTATERLAARLGTGNAEGAVIDVGRQEPEGVPAEPDLEQQLRESVDQAKARKAEAAPAEGTEADGENLSPSNVARLRGLCDKHGIPVAEVEEFFGEGLEGAPAAMAAQIEGEILDRAKAKKGGRK